MGVLHSSEFDVKVPGGSLPCIRFGQGGQALIMLPGLRTTSIRGTAAFAAWYYRRFAKAFTVYMLDRKEPVASDCTIHDHAGDVFAAMEALGLPRAAVFGVSQGGMIALDLAIHHPDSVRRLALGVTASRVNPTIEQAIGAWVGLVQSGDISGFARDYVARGYSLRAQKRYGRLLPLAFRLQRMMPAERFVALARSCLTCDCYRQLDRIRCPVLVLGGDSDRVVGGEASREIAERLGCECHLYPGLSHEAYSEAKDFNQRVFDFLVQA